MKKLLAIISLCSIFLSGCAVGAAGISDRQTKQFDGVGTSGGSSAFSAVVLPPPPETVPAETASEPVKADPVTEIVSGAAAPEVQSQKPDGNTEAELVLNGPNMLYVGESFSYSFTVNGKTKKEPMIRWKCSGMGASVNEEGMVEALRKGEVYLTVVDLTNQLSDTLEIHIIETAADVDFVPEVNGIPIVNKTYPLSRSYCPGDLADEVYDAFGELKNAAAADGLDIFMISGFRSYEFQQQVHDGWVEEYGEELADTLSARPGFSEHQLGYSIDVNSVWSEFAASPEGIWLAENCWRFGFVIRYPAGKEAITGYIYEPWHIRYLGKELARELTEKNLCLEEYLGVDSRYR